MSSPVQAILFDIGGTLRDSRPVPAAKQIAIIESIASLLGSNIPPGELLPLLIKRRDAYLLWARETLIELDEAGQWTKWLLPDWPADQISDQAIELNRLWRQATGERYPFPETKQVVRELFNRGYRLGVVSNTVSSLEVPELLDQLEISGCFEVIILSCLVGVRKPDPALLLEATRRMEIHPADCAYIGNKLDRDVVSARKAGFRESVLVLDPKAGAQFSADPAIAPTHTVNHLAELLDLFPPLQRKPAPPSVLNASLSTMWAKKYPSLNEFFEGSRRMGFKQVELNHQIDSSLLDQADLGQVDVSSIHEPCPADIPTWELKKRDWLLSSLDLKARQEGIRAVKHSVDLAQKLGASVVVIHAGCVLPDLIQENRLRDMVAAGMEDTQEYHEIRQEMVHHRSQLAGPHLEAVAESLKELLAYANPIGVQLGLENRFHYYDIPSLDEMGQLLILDSPERLGFIFDIGHAQALDRLGFFRHADWLVRYAERILGIHIHDVRGVTDHLAPGLGEVDYEMFAGYLPANAFRTLEIHPGNTAEELSKGLKILEECQLIKKVS